ncbi:MAG: hypothetical protein JO305_07825 [Alphaproteobacteria bacterium]|nr:hypothetical protein [Alphaproteobacteria bacterium]
MRAACGAGLAVVCLLALGGCDSGDLTGGPARSGRAAAVKPWAKRLSPEEARRAGSTGPLLPFLSALDAIESGRLDDPVSVIQIGDSHSFSDFLSGHMRELLQQRFGAAGRGMLPPGVAGRYYRPELVTAAQSEGWQRISADKARGGPFGLAGLIQETAQADERMSLGAAEEAGFDRAFVEILRHPGGGSLRVQIDDMAPQTIAGGGDKTIADWIALDAPRHSRTLSLAAAGDGSVDVLAWGIQRQQRGVLYENFGTIGATVGIIGHWDPAVIAGELARRTPALLIIAFGTNEGFENPADLGGYAERFAARVSELAAAAPQAAILVVAPPDGNRRYRVAAGTAPGCVEAPPGAAPPAAPVRQGAHRMRQEHAFVWAPPPGLALVREAQRQVAEAQGWYYWDWSEAMGGACSMYRWALQDPPLGGEDHIHLRAAGYRLTADKLFATLMEEYRRYRSRPTS